VSRDGNWHWCALHPIVDTIKHVHIGSFIFLSVNPPQTTIVLFSTAAEWNFRHSNIFVPGFDMFVDGSKTTTSWMPSTPPVRYTYPLRLTAAQPMMCGRPNDKLPTVWGSLAGCNICVPCGPSISTPVHANTKGWKRCMMVVRILQHLQTIVPN
jgi:hypothetical protein